MEKNTTRTADGVEVYENEILFFLDQYLSEHPDIEDLHQEPQSRWNAILRYIYKYTFKGTDKLKVNDLYRQTNNKFNHSNDNSYDIDKVFYILNIYIDLCFEYGKEVSIVGFSYLTGIEQETIYTWSNDNSSSYNSTHKRCEIYKKLSTTREESLSDRLYSSKGNPVGVLGILNHWYGWNMGQPHGSSDNKPRSVEQIQAEYTGGQGGTPEKLPPIAKNTPLVAETPPAGETAPASEEIPAKKESRDQGENPAGIETTPQTGNNRPAESNPQAQKITPHPKK